MFSKKDFNFGNINTDSLKQSNVYELGRDKIHIDGYTFDKQNVSNNPNLLFMLILCIDPTKKQKELLNKLEVRFEDDNGNIIFPKEGVNDDNEDKDQDDGR